MVNEVKMRGLSVAMAATARAETAADEKDEARTLYDKEHDSSLSSHVGGKMSYSQFLGAGLVIAMCSSADHPLYGG